MPRRVTGGPNVAGAKYVVGGSKRVAGFRNGLWWVENGVLVARVNQKLVEIFKKNTPRAQMTPDASFGPSPHSPFPLPPRTSSHLKNAS